MACVASCPVWWWDEVMVTVPGVGVWGWGGDLLLISSYTLYHQLSERGHTEDTREPAVIEQQVGAGQASHTNIG